MLKEEEVDDMEASQVMLNKQHTLVYKNEQSHVSMKVHSHMRTKMLPILTNKVHERSNNGEPANINCRQLFQPIKALPMCSTWLVLPSNSYSLLGYC